VLNVTNGGCIVVVFLVRITICRFSFPVSQCVVQIVSDAASGAASSFDVASLLLAQLGRWLAFSAACMNSRQFEQRDLRQWRRHRHRACRDFPCPSKCFIVFQVNSSRTVIHPMVCVNVFMSVAVAESICISSSAADFGPRAKSPAIQPLLTRLARAFMLLWSRAAPPVYWLCWRFASSFSAAVVGCVAIALILHC
jgi:hypothetical protein